MIPTNRNEQHQNCSIWKQIGITHHDMRANHGSIAKKCFLIPRQTKTKGILVEYLNEKKKFYETHDVLYGIYKYLKTSSFLVTRHTTTERKATPDVLTPNPNNTNL